MAKCIKLQRTKTQVCAGSLDKRIAIYQRSITTLDDPTGAFSNYGESFTLLKNTWAMIQTPDGQTIFDSIGTEKIVSDVFYVRYITGLTSENWVTYAGNRYDIQTIENLEENNLFQRLNCILSGDENLAASEA